jgi:transcriptional regulator with XRE-family HTH domain
MNSSEREQLIQGFSKRFEECVNEAGSIYALAKACGVAIPTLKRYFSGSEPSLTMLVKIAEAANVRVEWLATGKGVRRDPKAVEAEANSADPAFVIRLRKVLEILGEESLKQYSGEARVDFLRIQQFIAGNLILDPSEAWRLIEAYRLSLVWVVTGKGFFPNIRRSTRSKSWDFASSVELVEALEEQLAQIQQDSIRIHPVRANSLSPEVQIGDIAFVDTSGGPELGPGIFLVEDGDSAEYLARVLQNKDEYEMSFSGKDIASFRRKFDNDEGFKVLGRVVYVCRLIRCG